MREGDFFCFASTWVMAASFVSYTTSRQTEQLNFAWTKNKWKRKRITSGFGFKFARKCKSAFSITRAQLFKAAQTLVFQLILMSYYFVTLRVTFLRARSVRFFASSFVVSEFLYFFLVSACELHTKTTHTKNQHTKSSTESNSRFSSGLFYAVQFFLCNSALKIGKC